MVESIQNKFPCLPPEALEDARTSANKVWAEAIKLLGIGPSRMISSKDNSGVHVIKIFGEKYLQEISGKECEMDLKINHDCFNMVGDSSGKYVRVLKKYVFNRENGGHVYEKVYIDGEIIEREAGKSELEDLFEVLKNDPVKKMEVADEAIGESKYLPLEIREEAQNVGAKIFLDCHKILGDQDFLGLTFAGSKGSLPIGILGRKSLRESQHVDHDESIDLVIRIDKSQNPEGCGKVINYVFRRTCHDDGYVMKEVISYAPQLTFKEKEMDKHALEALRNQIRDSDQAMAKFGVTRLEETKENYPLSNFPTAPLPRDNR